MNKAFKLFCLLALISLLSEKSEAVNSLNASLLNSYGYNNQSTYIGIIGGSIDTIDPNAFSGYTKLTILQMQSLQLSKLDLELFKDSSSVLNSINFPNNPLTQFTNAKKLTFPSLQSLNLMNCPLSSIDVNLANGLPNLVTFDNRFNLDMSPLKANQLSKWSMLQNLYITTKNQLSLNKQHFTGLNSLNYLYFQSSNIKTIDSQTFSSLSNLGSIDLTNNSLTSLDYLKMPIKTETFILTQNNMNFLRLSTTSKGLKQLDLSYNRFRSFKSIDFSYLSSLTFLSLSSNPHAYPCEFPSHLKYLSNLINLKMRNLSISTIDSNYFINNTKLQSIDLSYNNIISMSWDSINRLGDLNYLDLTSNQLTNLDNRTFSGLNNLYTLYLFGNRLWRIAPGTFNNLANLNYISLNQNELTQLYNKTFVGCSNLRTLDFTSNQIASIAPRTFDTLDLNYLYLANNQLTELDWLTFDGAMIANLDLSSNKISQIGPGTFSGLNMTQNLNLNNNLLTELHNYTFIGLQRAYVIRVSNNMLTRIEPGTFNGLTSLQSVSLDGNQLTELDSTTFAGCTNLHSISLTNNPNLPTGNLQSLCPNSQCRVYY